MDRLISCEFNMDNACVELKFANGSMIAIDTIAVENEVADNMYQRSESVSYTHLDVYKRQMPHCTKRLPFASGRLLTVPLSPMETMRTASPFLSCSGSVSYTHLDVYKRQKCFIMCGSAAMEDGASMLFVRCYKAVCG